MGVQRAAPNAALLLAVAPSVSSLQSNSLLFICLPGYCFPILVTGVPRCCLMLSCVMHCDLLTHRILPGALLQYAYLTEKENLLLSTRVE